MQQNGSNWIEQATMSLQGMAEKGLSWIEQAMISLQGMAEKGLNWIEQAMKVVSNGGFHTFIVYFFIFVKNKFAFV